MAREDFRRGLGRRVAWLAAPLLLAACGGDDTSPAAQQGAQGGGGGGSLVGLAAAQQGAEQWWSDHEQALVKRDVKALARLDAQPQLALEVELLRASVGMQRPVLSQARQPSAVRVHVPATQSWPVPVLAVFDVPSGSGGGSAHLAVLLSKGSVSGALVAAQSATLGAPEPAFDTDPAGYVRMGQPATDLTKSYATYMQSVAHGTPAPSPAPIAPGKLTSEAAASDAAMLNDPAGHSKGSLSAVDIDYAALAQAAPVFGLSGGGGLAVFATQRTQTLHPNSGQALLQDPQRHNYGVDLAPGQYQQIAAQSVVVLAVRLPADGAPAEVLGSGGGITQEG
jgi:hypothetical protein